MFSPVAEAMGVEIFEMEVPNSRSRVLRVYIAPSRKRYAAHVSSETVPPETVSPDIVSSDGAAVADDGALVDERGGKRGVSLDECAAFSKALSRIEGFDDLFIDQWTLEVSSPGINRRLTRAEHFEGAVGERVKVKYRGGEDKNVVARGVLKGFDGTMAKICDEDSGEELMIAYHDVQEARVDFLFSSER